MGYSRPLKNGRQTNKTVSRSSEAAPLTVTQQTKIATKTIKLKSFGYSVRQMVLNVRGASLLRTFKSWSDVHFSTA